METQRLVSEDKGLEVIENKHPLGTFYFFNEYTEIIGVNNGNGDAFSEVFADVASCLRWLGHEAEVDDMTFTEGGWTLYGRHDS